ncbi:MAG: hypothetical protein ABSF23_14140 [Terracidiphilus sp.]|jgi:hypothetical protein
MIENRYQRVWVAVAAIAIVAALVLMLVPQAHSGDPGAWLAILPVLFVGVIAPLRLLAFLERSNPGYTADAPAFEPCFQRPPPIWLG